MNANALGPGKGKGCICSNCGRQKSHNQKASNGKTLTHAVCSECDTISYDPSKHRPAKNDLGGAHECLARCHNRALYPVAEFDGKELWICDVCHFFMIAPAREKPVKVFRPDDDEGERPEIIVEV